MEEKQAERPPRQQRELTADFQQMAVVLGVEVSNEVVVYERHWNAGSHLRLYDCNEGSMQEEGN